MASVHLCLCIVGRGGQVPGHGAAVKGLLQGHGRTHS